MNSKIVFPNHNGIKAQSAQARNASACVFSCMPIVAEKLNNFVGAWKNEVRIHTTQIVVENPRTIAGEDELLKRRVEVNLKLVLSPTSGGRERAYAGTIDFPAGDCCSFTNGCGITGKLASAMSANSCVSGNCFSVTISTLALFAAKLWVTPIKHAMPLHVKLVAAVLATLHVAQFLTASWSNAKHAFSGAVNRTIRFQNAIRFGVKHFAANWACAIGFNAKLFGNLHDGTFFTDEDMVGSLVKVREVAGTETRYPFAIVAWISQYATKMDFESVWRFVWDSIEGYNLWEPNLFECHFCSVSLPKVGGIVTP